MSIPLIAEAPSNYCPRMYSVTCLVKRYISQQVYQSILGPNNSSKALEITTRGLKKSPYH